MRNEHVSRLHGHHGYDPFKFEEENDKYRVFSGSLHVKHGVLLAAALRVLLFTLLALLLAISSQSPLYSANAIFCVCIVVLCSLSLLAGLRLESQSLLIPSLFFSVLALFLLALYTTVHFLQLSDLREDLSFVAVLANFFLLSILFLEAYFLFILWRTFVYICDLRMNSDAHDRRRQSKIYKGIPNPRQKDRREAGKGVVTAAESLSDVSIMSAQEAKELISSPINIHSHQDAPQGPLFIIA